MPIYNIHLSRCLPGVVSNIVREIVAGNEKAAKRKAQEELPGWVAYDPSNEPHRTEGSP